MIQIRYTEFFVACSLLLACSGFAFKKSQESDHLKYELDLTNQQVEILRDQIEDQNYLLSNQRTYEEGVLDGIHDSKNQDYMRGYHIATQQLFTESNDSLTSN